MDKTDIQNKLETIQACIETLNTVYQNFEDFGGCADMCLRDSLCEITFIVQAQQKIIEGLVETISISTKEQKHKIKIDECSMSPRLSNLMCNFGYEYLEDVYDYWVINGDNGLLKKSSFGRKSLNELKDIFKEYKLQETKNND